MPLPPMFNRLGLAFVGAIAVLILILLFLNDGGGT